MEIEYKENILTASDFASFQKKMGWPQESIEVLKTAIANSLFTLVATIDNSIVGFARLVGDGAMFWYIQDVFVLNEYYNRYS